MKLNQLVENKREQWSKAAMINFANHGKRGGEFKTEKWANGKVMVTPVAEWGTAMNAVSRDIAVAIFKNGWKVPADLIK
jgi:hypothetical protein